MWGNTLQQAYKDFHDHQRFVNPMAKFQRYIRNYNLPEHNLFDDSLTDPIHQIILNHIKDIYNPFRRTK